jgi:hypothetical protein
MKTFLDKAKELKPNLTEAAIVDGQCPYTLDLEGSSDCPNENEVPYTMSLCEFCWAREYKEEE